MCMQCETDAVIVESEIIPGFALMVARKSSRVWHKGQFAIVRCNDPDWILPMVTYLENPFFMTNDDEEDDEVPDEQHEKFMEFVRFAEVIEATQPADIRLGWEIVESLREHGYNPERDGYRVTLYLAHVVARAVNKYQSLGVVN